MSGLPADIINVIAGFVAPKGGILALPYIRVMRLISREWAAAIKMPPLVIDGEEKSMGALLRLFTITCDTVSEVGVFAGQCDERQRDPFQTNMIKFDFVAGSLRDHSRCTVKKLSVWQYSRICLMGRYMRVIIISLLGYYAKILPLYYVSHFTVDSPYILRDIMKSPPKRLRLPGIKVEIAEEFVAIETKDGSEYMFYKSVSKLSNCGLYIHLIFIGDEYLCTDSIESAGVLADATGGVVFSHVWMSS